MKQQGMHHLLPYLLKAAGVAKPQGGAPAASSVEQALPSLVSST